MNIKEIIKKDGTKVYRTNVYLGVDSLTGKKVQTTATGKTRKLCEIKANQAINNFIKNGCTVARKKIKFKNFSDLALSWFESYKLTVKANSIRVTNNFLKVYILPVLGVYKIDKITPILLQEIVNKWAKNANTAAIINGKREKGKCKDYRLLLNIIKRIFEYGIQLGAINSNPAIQVVPPKLNNREIKKIKFFSNEELRKFLTYLDSLEPTIENQMRKTLYLLLLSTGLRIGEALALNWSDIDFIHKTLSVNKTIVQAIENRNSVQQNAKTRESNRTITLDENTIHLLMEWKKCQNNKVVSISDLPIFSYQDSTCKYVNEQRTLKKHFKLAKVSDIGFHGFRHTHASLLMNNDVNPKEIQARLGHADYAITMNTYSHLAEDKKKDTAEKFSSILKAL